MRLAARACSTGLLLLTASVAFAQYTPPGGPRGRPASRQDLLDEQRPGQFVRPFEAGDRPQGLGQRRPGSYLPVVVHAIQFQLLSLPDMGAAACGARPMPCDRSCLEWTTGPGIVAQTKDFPSRHNLDREPVPHSCCSVVNGTQTSQQEQARPRGQLLGRLVWCETDRYTATKWKGS